MNNAKTYKFLFFLLQFFLIVSFFFGLVALFNYSIDASCVVAAKSHNQMAKLALEGNIISVPQNYNERVFQLAVVEKMKTMPETIVIGSSRGMYLGEKTTSFKNIYNNCVSGACIEDYYALVGLYYQKFSKLPSRIIVEISPWIFFDQIPESRWLENYTYRTACEKLYKKINKKTLVITVKKENPYFSIPYLQYNYSILKEQGFKAFISEKPKVSTDISEFADYPDGTIRYKASQENESPERLNNVKSKQGAVSYQNAHKMKELGSEKKQAFETLIGFLINNGVDVIFYLAPLSITQSKISFDKRENIVFKDVEAYLRGFAEKNNIKIVGGYDARKYNLSDNNFIDYMHLDKVGSSIIWSTNYIQ